MSNEPKNESGPAHPANKTKLTRVETFRAARYIDAHYDELCKLHRYQAATVVARAIGVPKMSAETLRRIAIDMGKPFPESVFNANRATSRGDAHAQKTTAQVARRHVARQLYETIIAVRHLFTELGMADKIPERLRDLTHLQQIYRNESIDSSADVSK